MKRSLTLRYMFHQMAYWAAAAGIMSFASAFLLAKDFPASQVGVLLAAGNLLSCALQPVLADRADRAKGNILTAMVVGLTGLTMACFTSLLFLPLPRWLFGLLYLLGIFTFDRCGCCCCVVFYFQRQQVRGHANALFARNRGRKSVWWRNRIEKAGSSYREDLSEAPHNYQDIHYRQDARELGGKGARIRKGCVGQ